MFEVAFPSFTYRKTLDNKKGIMQWPKKCHGNFNLFTAISILLTAISIYLWQFQFAHGNFNLLMAISITHSNFNFLRQRSRHFSLLSPPVNFGGRQWPPKVKTQNQKSIFKVGLQSEKWKSNIESRFTNTYASRQWVYTTNEFTGPRKYKLYLTIICWPVKLKMVQSLTFIQALKLLLSLVYWCYW